MPKLGAWQADLDRLLEENAGRASRERLTLMRVLEALRGLGYEGGYDTVRRYARGWPTSCASAASRSRPSACATSGCGTTWPR